MDKQLLNDIKFNCDVSDAQYWGYFSVCGLLMRYRDLYRSERSLKPWKEINREEIMSWISSKESRWPELEEKGFRDLKIAENTYGPFDVVEVNRALKDRNKLLIQPDWANVRCAESRPAWPRKWVTIFQLKQPVMAPLYLA